MTGAIIGAAAGTCAIPGAFGGAGIKKTRFTTLPVGAGIAARSTVAPVPTVGAGWRNRERERARGMEGGRERARRGERERKKRV